MGLKDVLKKFPAISFESDLHRAKNVLTSSRFDSVIVLRNGIPVGVLSAFEVLEKIVDGSKLRDIRVGDVMTHHILAFEADTELEEAAKIMLAHRHWMAIVTEKGKYQGVVTAGGLLKELH